MSQPIDREKNQVRRTNVLIIYYYWLNPNYALPCPSLKKPAATKKWLFYLGAWAQQKPVQHFGYWNRIWDNSLNVGQRSNADKLTHWKLIKLHTNKLSIILKTLPGLIAYFFHAGLDEFVEDQKTSTI
jgi:hypothetical protein